MKEYLNECQAYMASENNIGTPKYIIKFFCLLITILTFLYGFLYSYSYIKIAIAIFVALKPESQNFLDPGLAN